MAIHVVLDPAAHFKKCVASSEVPKPEHAGLKAPVVSALSRQHAALRRDADLCLEQLSD
jgi:hypothetical protein